MKAGSHPTRQQLEEYSQIPSDSVRAKKIEDHVKGCVDCAENLLRVVKTTIGRPDVNCQTCDALQADYQHAVTLYTNAERNLQGLREDDYKLAFEKAVQLRLACEDALATVRRHWRQAHGHSSQAVGTT